MIKKFLLIVSVVLGTSVGSVAAATLTRADCEASGGTYSNNQGTKTCVMPVSSEDPSGNSGNAWTVEGSSSQGQHGSIGAPGTSDTYEQSTTTDSCTNPGGNPMKLTNNHCQL